MALCFPSVFVVVAVFVDRGLLFPVYLFMSIYLPIYLSVCLSVCLPVSLSVCLFDILQYDSLSQQTCQCDLRHFHCSYDVGE